MKRNKASEVVLKTLAKATEHEAKVNMHGWPPRCTGIFHQPKRPTKK